jgi:uncharacterized protein (TIGR02757 family)
MPKSLKLQLDKAYENYAQSCFIANDPISIPHSFSLLQDIEIAGFFAAIFSWGRRDTIISKSQELMKLMNKEPFYFVQNYSPKDFKNISNFKHRTFNASDLDFYIRAFQKHYAKHHSLEKAFTPQNSATHKTIESHLTHFYPYLTSLVSYEKRNLKHISTPQSGAACKRLCMYLRWMVRKDEVDLGLWKNIKPSQLVMPLDVHVIRLANELNLIDENDKPCWKTALKLTEKLGKLDKTDPVKYDLALFSLGVDTFKPTPSSIQI